MTSRFLTVPTSAAVFISILLALVGVSFPADAQDEDVTAMLEASAAAMLELESFHFELTTPTGKTILSDGIYLESVQGDVVRPLSFQATFEVSLAFLDIELSAIGIDEDIWITNPLEGGGYMQVTGEGEETLPPLPFLNPDELIREAISQIQDPQITGTDELDGVQATVVEGTFDPAAITVNGTPVAEELLGEMEPLDLTLWIDPDNRVIRVELSGGLLPSEIGAGRVVRRIDLSQFDEPVTIEPPVS